MNAGQRSVQRLAASKSAVLLSRDSVCLSCLSRLAAQPRRHAASTATATEQAAPTQHNSSIPPVTQTEPRKAYRILSSPVVSRAPLLTRDLTAFEKAFYLYQKRLNERLALPFTRYFYYKKGTPGDLEWKRKLRARKSAARDIGVYSAYDDDAWHDEVLVGDKTSEPSTTVEALIQDAEGKDIVGREPVGDAETEGKEIRGDPAEGEGIRKILGQEVVVERPRPRLTDADLKNDQRSLDRKMDRTLYLLVQNKDGRWRFPEDRVYGRETLHQSAERTLVQAFGINMNTWFIGNQPIGHYAFNFPSPITSTISSHPLVPTSVPNLQQEEFGEKVFFMKARIMAGLPDIGKNEYGDQDFRWLAKEEVEEVVTPKYWSSVRNMLVAR